MYTCMCGVGSTFNSKSQQWALNRVSFTRVQLCIICWADVFTIVVVGMVVCVEGAACGPPTICSAVTSGCLWRKYSFRLWWWRLKVMMKVTDDTSGMGMGCYWWPRNRWFGFETGWGKMNGCRVEKWPFLFYRWFHVYTLWLLLQTHVSFLLQS